jgi:hypothetical protein
VYALSKLNLSLQIYSLPVIELDPSHSATVPKSPYPSDHVALAYAIVLANSVLEELGLEIRASQKNPSFRNGEWNPLVRDNLVERLTKAGIDLSEKYLWDLRGGKTALERARRPRIISNAPWATWNVRSGMVEVVDAIAHVDWLRSKVSAHRLKPEFAKVLSAYDAANAQFLARRLLLESAGFWPRE